jgi:hypothetical protein
MNRPREPQGRYIKSKLDLSNKVPSDFFGGRNVLSTQFSFLTVLWCMGGFVA